MSSVPKSKEELESAINEIPSKLMLDYRSIPTELTREIGIDGNIKGTKISVCDTVSYLVGWGSLVLKWHRLSERGEPVDFPETGYKWNQLGLLADSFHKQYNKWTYSELINEYERVVGQILSLISSLDNEALYGDPWYENWTLGRMIQFNTSSPMKNIRTKVRRFKKVHNIK